MAEYAEEKAKQDTLLERMDLAERRRRDADHQQELLEDVHNTVAELQGAPALVAPPPSRKRGRIAFGMVLIVIGAVLGVAAITGGEPVLGAISLVPIAIGFSSLVR